MIYVLVDVCVCLLAKYLLNQWADSDETLLDLQLELNNYKFLSLKSAGFTDKKLKCGLIVAERRLRHIFYVLTDCATSLLKTLAC